MRISKSFSKIGFLVSESLSAMEIDTKVKEQASILAWDEVVGKQVAGAAQPQFVTDGCLFVITKSSVWANELTFRKRDIIARLNSRVGGNIVKEIVFKVGRVYGKRGSPPQQESDRHSLEGMKLTDEEQTTIEEIARAAGDEAYEPFKKMFAAFMRLEHWKQSHAGGPPQPD